MTKTCTFELQINFETNQARDGCLSTIMILSCPEDILYALMCVYIYLSNYIDHFIICQVLKEMRYGDEKSVCNM